MTWPAALALVALASALTGYVVGTVCAAERTHAVGVALAALLAVVVLA